MHLRALKLFLLFLAVPSALSSPIDDTAAFLNDGAFVPLRIEGARRTVFEGHIFTKGHNITTASGGNHHCDGTNFGAHRFPGPTATSALADAAKQDHFTFDGTFDPDFDDFLITRIGGSAQTSSKFWGLLINFRFSQVGGCQARTTPATHVLWAFDAFSANAFLFLDGPESVRRGESATLVVRNGTGGNPISGANVGVRFGTTNSKGEVSVTFSDRGQRTLKAEKNGAIRSNALTITVT